MHKLLVCGTLAVLLLASCGKSNNDEENCPGCTEQSLNRPVGQQPPEEPKIPYDQGKGNPPRDSLQFPPYSSSWGLSRRAFQKAIQYYVDNKDHIENPRYFLIADFSLHSSKKRLFLFDLSNGSVEKHNVAHGKNSDSDNDGIATTFSNQPGSLMSSLGFYKTLATYNGSHGLSLKLAGLSPTNDNAEERAIVMHPANYVSDSDGRAGRSWGCPALDPAVSKSIIDRVKDGAMLLIDK